MKKLLLIFSLLFLSGSFALAMDEADIPPPPMPEYMKNNPEYQKQQRNMASETEAEPEPEVDGQSAESIKQEFLQAGDENEDLDNATLDSEVANVQEGSIEEAAVIEMEEKPVLVVEEDPKPEAIEEVSEVEVAAPELEQAEIEEPAAVEAQQAYQQDVGNEMQAAEKTTPEEEQAAAQDLALVEEKLEAAEQAAEATLEKGRQPSGRKAFKPGMYKFDEECTMHEEPRSMSALAGKIRPGRKLWIDAHNSSWHKAYKKSGAVYISADCLSKR